MNPHYFRNIIYALSFDFAIFPVGSKYYSMVMAFRFLTLFCDCPLSIWIAELTV
jgi:hypothetical protein